MFNKNSEFFFQLISDAGFQGEITSISTAAQQIEVFSRILKSSVGHFLESNDDDRQKHIQECAVKFIFELGHIRYSFIHSFSKANDLPWSAYFRLQ